MDWCWRGRLPYAQALDEQRTHRRAILEGRADSVLWLLEHDPVVTTGRRVPEGTASRSEMTSRNVDFYETERGGLATYHGPGQLIGYLICDIGEYDLSVRKTICGIEEGLIRWLAGFGLTASRRKGFPGVWINNDKIAALGLHFRKGVSMHGFALNLTVDLSPYDLIVPCGITDGGVTSLSHLVDNDVPNPVDAAASVAQCILDALGMSGPVRN